jgi:HK97 gp10 family phage protein
MPATLKSRFPEIIAELRPKVGAAVKQAAEVVAEDASARAPDAPPYAQGLVESIRVEREDVAEYAVNAGGGAEFYAGFVEFGHAKRGGGEVPPHPFMVPAAEANRDTAAYLVTAALRSL